MAVGKFHLPIVTSTSGGNLIPDPYVRPSDWLEIDSLVVPGDQKIVILVAVFEEGNFVGLECFGNYTVDWGDGTTTNHTSGSDSYHQYDWNYSGFDGTLTSRGYKQAIITITPQAGQNLTVARLNKKHNQAGLVNGYTQPWLDIKMSAPLMTQLRIGAGVATDPRPRLLEQFDWIGTNLLTSCLSIFSEAIELRQVKNINTSSSTDFTNMFANCNVLEHLPIMNTSKGLNFIGMFSACCKLKSIPFIDTSKGTSFNSMFTNCVSIVEFPDLNCNAGTGFSSMFTGCRSMIKSPALILNPLLTKSFTNMFNNCVSMIEFVNINTMQGSVYNNMFQNCHSLRILPEIINTSGSINNVNFGGMFQNCYDLEKAPMVDFSKGSSCVSIFASCWSISEFPAYDFSSVTLLTSAFGTCLSLKRLPVMTIGSGITSFNTCFATCVSLEEAPDWNLQNPTDVTNMFNGCGNLRKVPAYNLSSVTLASVNMFVNNLSLIESNITGMKRTHSYANCKLSQTELVNVFNNLGVAVGAQTITISGNYGAAALTAGERAIATGKGWTIVG